MPVPLDLDSDIDLLMLGSIGCVNIVLHSARGGGRFLTAPQILTRIKSGESIIVYGIPVSSILVILTLSPNIFCVGV